MSARGRSVRLHLVDGTASGIVTAEVVNWSGHAVLAPRSRLSEFLRREEASRTGIYLLLGEVTFAGDPRPTYVGESDNVGKRLRQHELSDTKDFDRFCVFTSKDLNLTKAHARFLENRVEALARTSGRADVINGTPPASGTLPEADVADMEYFLEQIELVLPVLGFDILKRTPIASVEHERDREETHKNILQLSIRSTKHGIEAKGVERDGEVIVLKGSRAARTRSASMGRLRDRWEALVEDGSVTLDGDAYVFQRDVPFASPSTAAVMIMGRQTNGRTKWKVDGTSLTLKAHQDRKLAT